MENAADLLASRIKELYEASGLTAPWDPSLMRSICSRVLLDKDRVDEQWFRWQMSGDGEPPKAHWPMTYRED